MPIQAGNMDWTVLTHKLKSRKTRHLYCTQSCAMGLFENSSERATTLYKIAETWSHWMLNKMFSNIQVSQPLSK